MNKKSLKIAGWALGLTMAVAGIGVAVGASAKAPVETKAASNTTRYSLINSVGDLEAGKSYLITSGTSGTVKTMSTKSNTNNRPTTEVEVSDGEIERGSSAMSITLGGSAGAWTLSCDNYLGTGSYLGQGNQTGSNYLKVYSELGDGANGDTWTITFSGDAAVITSTKKSSRNIVRYNSANNLFSCYSSGQDPVYLFKEVPGPAGNIVPTGISVTDEGSSSVANSSTYEYYGDVPESITFTATPTYSNAAGCISGTEVSWTSSNTGVATVSNGVVTIKEKGTTTITVATTDATNPSDNKSLSFTLDTNDATYVSGKHINAPYSVSDACTAIDSGTDAQKNGVYVAGIISQIDEYNSTYKSITYWISADGTTTDQFEVYSGKGLNGADFNSASDLKLGSEVVVYGNIKKFGDVYEFASNNTIVSLTIPTFTVSFNANGGTGTMDPDTDVEIGSYTLPDNGFTAPDGKEFAGWKVNNLGDLLAEGDSYNLTSDVVLYAQWNDLVTLSYDANGGTGSMTGGSYGSGASVTVKSNAFTAPSGMIFDNWNTQDDGEGTSYAPGAVFNITANTTLYAQWATKVTLSYNGNGATGGSTAPSDYKSGATATVASNGFTAPTGMRFKEWNTQDDGEGTSYAAGASIVSFASDLTLYAIWEDLPKEVVAKVPDTLEANYNFTADTNEAASIGLDNTVWGAYSEKNDATTEVGLNSTYDTIRLYSKKSSSNGGTIKLKSLDAAVYIESITLDFNASSDTEDVTVKSLNSNGTVASTLSGTDDTYIVNNVGVSIQNTHSNDSSKANQVHFDSITITWNYVDTFKDAQTFEKNCVKLDIPYPGSTPTGVVGTDCLSVLEGGDGRYHYAKGQYEGLDDQAKIWFATRPEFANARERLIAWGAANHETVSFEADGSMNVSSAKVVFNSMVESADMKVITVAAVALVGVVTAGGIFFVARKHRREEN